MSAQQSVVIRTHLLRLGIGATLVLGLCLGVTGCARAPAAAPAAAPISVTVSYPVERDVTDYADFTARIAAVDSVEVRAHVWGYLDKVNFKEGALVKKGDVLFELDPRPYQALLDQAKAKVRQDEAQLRFDEAEYQRNLNLFNQGGVVTLGPGQSQRRPGTSMSPPSRPTRPRWRPTQLDLDYTKVTAPVSGRDQPLQRHGGQPDPVGGPGRRHPAHHDRVGGPDVRLLRRGRAHRPARPAVDPRRQGRGRPTSRPGPCRWAWPPRRGFPHQGTINFVDNQVNPKTGTLRVRGVFPNKDEALTPGYFARVRVPIGRPHQALLVSDRALDNDQGQKILYVVNDKNEVVSRPVRVGALHDGLRAIEDGLKPGERVIVNGLQQVRPGITVEPKLVAMPTSGVRKPDASAERGESHARFATPDPCTGRPR